MSADNGIYVAKFPDGYRVCHAQAIENIDYYPDGSKERTDTIRDYFGGSLIYATKEEALIEAHRMEEECEILEYGVSYLGELPSI